MKLRTQRWNAEPVDPRLGGETSSDHDGCRARATSRSRQSPPAEERQRLLVVGRQQVALPALGAASIVAPGQQSMKPLNSITSAEHTMQASIA